jgi:RNA polymerase-binding transcription factor
VTRKELEVFKQQLLNEKTLLLLGITSSKVDGSPKTGDPEGGDVCDIATSDRDRELRLRLTERGREKLREIEDALERIEEGSFGTCERCGAKIPKGRLKVMPFTTTCVGCKSKQERQRKLFEGAGDFSLSRELGAPEINKEDED